MDAQKTEMIVSMKAEMARYLRSKTWEEKVASIERMNEAGKIARRAMREALEAKSRQA